jgi:TPR repeat protein
LYENGIVFKKNMISAALNYILASQLNYPRAKAFLLKTLTRDFYDEVIAEIINRNSVEAKFVFYGLWNLGLYNNIIKDDAIKHLIEAANQNHLPSINELGNYYYTLENFSSRTEGINLWRKAKSLGSYQAEIRLATINILDGIKAEPLENSVLVLINALNYGSVLSQIAMAFAYENGIGVAKSKSEAVKLYRLTAQRGNESGYEELKRMFDEIRPKDPRFIVN